MKLEEFEEWKVPNVPQARYRVTLSTKVGGHLIAFQTRLNAGSPKEAEDEARRIFRKSRSEIQEAVLRQWDVRELTPLVRRS